MRKTPTSSSIVPESLLDAVTLYDQILPSTRKVLHALIEMKTWITGELFPGYAFIARESKIGTTQVKKCIKQALELGLLTLGRKPKVRSYTYTLNKFIEEACIQIKACHFSYNWKKNRKTVIQDVAEDELFFAKLLNRRGQLSTPKVSHCPLSKVSTILILSSLNKSVRRDRVEEPPAFREQAIQQKRNTMPIQEGSPYLWGIKMKPRDVEALTFMNSPQELKEARGVFDFMRYKKDIFIHNPAAFIISQIKKMRKNERRTCI